MASSKLSALTAITAAGDDDLIYVADTADGGSTYASKRITRGNLFTGIATESYVTTAIANLVDGAPGALDTLNELAAAMADDASLSTTLTNLINANETHIDNVATLTGVAKDSVNFGTFTGSTITANQTLKAILQLLETAVETKAASTTVTEVDGNVDDLISAVGVAEQATDLGTFSGTTIADSQTVKQALQTLETAVESKGSATSLTSLTTAVGDLNTLSGVAQNATNLGTFTGSTITDNQPIKTVAQQLETAVETKVTTGANVNTLVGVTSAETAPQSSGEDNYLFLVVDKSDGSIKAIDKTFLEAEG
jgi:hypothetical protein